MTTLKEFLSPVKGRIKDLALKLKALFSNYLHVICLLMTFGFLALSIFYFKWADVRICESLRDLWTSLLFYGAELLELNSGIKPTVVEYSVAPLELPFYLPETWEEFQVLWSKYWEVWASKENFDAWIVHLGDVLYYVSKVLCIFAPVVTAITVTLSLKERPRNNDHNKDSKYLTRWKKFERKVFLPVRSWILNFFRFVVDKGYLKLWAWIWAYNFNIIAMVIEFIAFYLYFVASFDFVNIYVQVLKFLQDLSVALFFLPLIVWIVLCYLLIDYLRKKIGYERLNHMERKNRGFIN